MKTLMPALAVVSIVSSATSPGALAVRTAIEASGNVQMNAALRSYQDNVLKVVTKECLDEKANKECVVSLTVDPHGNIMRVVLTNTGLPSPKVMDLINALKALKLGDAGEGQSDTLRITFDFDLAEVLAGAKSTGTSLSIHGGSVTGDGTATGGIRIGGGGSIISGGNPAASGATPNANLSVRRGLVPPDQIVGQAKDQIKAQLQAQKDAALSKLAEAEKSADGKPQELCNARISAALVLWQAEDAGKAREVLGQALKYLEGPAGPINFATARSLSLVAQQMLTGTAGNDQDLIWRVYAVIEKKASNGVGDGDLYRLGRLRGQTGNFLNGDQVISVLSRLLELRELREGTTSIKLISVLNSLATADDLLQKSDAAAKLRRRVESIQQINAKVNAQPNTLQNSPATKP